MPGKKLASDRSLDNRPSIRAGKESCMGKIKLLLVLPLLAAIWIGTSVGMDEGNINAAYLPTSEGSITVGHYGYPTCLTQLVAWTCENYGATRANILGSMPWGNGKKHGNRNNMQPIRLSTCINDNHQYTGKIIVIG